MDLLWSLQPAYAPEFPQEWPGIVLALLFMALYAGLIWWRRGDFRKMRWPAWLFLGASLILIFPLYTRVVLYRTELGALPILPSGVMRATPLVSLLGLGLAMAVAVWLGPAPGGIAGLCAGLAWALLSPLSFTDVLAFASWGFAVGFCLHQPYKGELFDVLRQPLVGLPIAVLVPVFMLSISRLVGTLPPRGLLAVDYMAAIWGNELPLWLVSGLILGGIFQFLFLNPSWRPDRRNDKVSIYSRSLRARVMIVSIPLVLLSIVLSVLAVTHRAITLARAQALEEMQRNANNASDGIAHFHMVSTNLLLNFANDPALLDPATRTRVLQTNRQIVPFFEELVLVDGEREVIEGVPAKDEWILTREEAMSLEQALEFHISLVTNLTVMPSGAYGLTVVHPVFPEGRTAPEAVLLGRVYLDMNPEMRRALEMLQWTRGIGAGFILDSRGLIIAHPDPELILRPWEINYNQPRYPVDAGLAYEDIAPPDGQRVINYIVDVTGTPYRVVLQLPFSAVLETAGAISSPLLFVQLSVGVLLLITIPFFTTRVIRPVNTLAEGANHIAQGNLDIPVDISGEDEVAQLGRAFEQMRVRLQARLNDLSLLLSVAQRVSATLDLDRGGQPILEGALEETGAVVARFVLLSGGDRPQRVFSEGREDAAFDALDRAFAAAVSRRRDPLVISDLSQGTHSVPHTGLQSVAIFPVRTQNSTVAVLWVGASGKDAFDGARVNFLSTLASQAAVLVENSRLFQTAEGGRRRLAAILASTSDAILVSDSGSRLLLINPAAQRLLALSEASYGRTLASLALPEALIDALMRSDGEQQPPTVEIPFEDGRTFYASIAPIMGAEGLTMGKVVVMRDVTHFKELDEMKSEFVATVSHDLRAPLTFIRGYATMLMMVGDLNEKQEDYLHRILEGIDQMSALIGDLLNLRRIEAGVGIRHEACPLGLIMVESVDTMRARATGKGITLRLEPAEGAPTVIGDRTLLRQAVSNLVDNAIKYTPAAGSVRVGLDVNAHEVVIRISDTGIGIAPEDQVRLFEKFYRIKRRETGNIQGTGLGLALVKSIVERHGGRVWAESMVNEGSTFCIALPLPTDDALAELNE